MASNAEINLAIAEIAFNKAADSRDSERDRYRIEKARWNITEAEFKASEAVFDVYSRKLFAAQQELEIYNRRNEKKEAGV